MKYIIGILIVLLVLTSCSVNRHKAEFSFANKLAEAGLWKEAYFRWQSLVEKGESSAIIHNNMAIALEKMARYKEAEAEYKIAIKLAPGNTYISDNYRRFQNRFKEEPIVKKEGKKKNEN